MSDVLPEPAMIARLLTLLFLIATPALAASPDICRPYAAATAQSLMKFIWTRAYTSCLNEDEVRPVPTDWQNAMCVVLPDCQFAAPGSVPAVGELESPVKIKKHYRKKRKHRRHG